MKDIDKYKDVLNKLNDLSSVLSKSYAWLSLRKDYKKLDKNKKYVDFINNNFLKSYRASCEAVRINCLLNISLFWDNSSYINIDKLINTIESSKKSFNSEVFEQYSWDRLYLTELKARYQGITNKDIVDVREINKKYKELRQQIRNYRNEHIAHIWNKKYVYNLITVENLEKYLSDIDLIFKTISKKINFFVTDHCYFKEINELSNALKKYIK